KRRKDLLKVARLGEKTFEQCAGFLRIADGDEPRPRWPRTSCATVMPTARSSAARTC
ncbi:hypothetical protein C7E12_17605, partial [Stenotrophomonas maltophilia]